MGLHELDRDTREPGCPEMQRLPLHAGGTLTGEARQTPQDSDCREDIQPDLLFNL